jgi:hypothetical protein
VRPAGLWGLLFIAAALGGCFAPMTTREAQQIAGDHLARYCHGQCGAVKLAGTQRIRNRWLVDFDAPAHKFTVIVENDGNAKVTTWDKSRDAAGP